MVAILALGTIGFYFYQFASSPLQSAGTIETIEFDLYRGMNPVQVSNALERQNIIRSGRLMLWLGRATGHWTKIKSAEYPLRADMTPLQILDVLVSGIGVQKSILIREGENIYQIAERFESLGLGSSDEVLAHLKSDETIAVLGLEGEGIQTLEGYLLPNTYFFNKTDGYDELIKRMVRAFLATWGDRETERAKEIGFTRKEVVTLASMVEKETGASFERPMIAAVFHNRLKKKMRLQSDPTTIYGMWKNYQGNISKSDLRRPSDYNTYTLRGLPIGPIANPHPDAIQAALYPAATDYLFFVSKNDGTHTFSKTYKEHSHWVAELQKNPEARKGKSWRDLSESPPPR